MTSREKPMAALTIHSEPGVWVLDVRTDASRHHVAQGDRLRVEVDGFAVYEGQLRQPPSA